jgi:hypothetical protein
MKSDQSDSLFGQPALNVGSAMLGVMIEELSVIESKVAAEGTAASTQVTFIYKLYFYPPSSRLRSINSRRRWSQIL